MKTLLAATCLACAAVLAVPAHAQEGAAAAEPHREPQREQEHQPEPELAGTRRRD